MVQMEGGVIAFLLVSCFWICSSLHEVCIVPEHGINPKMPSCNSTATINDLCEQANTTESISDTVATFLHGTHTLDRNCFVYNVSNVTLRGQSGSKVLIQCKDTGFCFKEVHKLRISDIEFTSCGLEDTFYALLFIDGSELTLTSVNVTNSKYGGIFVRNIDGNVTLNACKVVNATSNNSRYGGGNAVLYQSVVVNVSLTISNSIFMNSGIPLKPNSHLPHSGLTLKLASPGLTVAIVNTTFTQNSGLPGGNMAILCFSPISITIANSTFHGGQAQFGGGLGVFFEDLYGFRHAFNRTT